MSAHSGVWQTAEEEFSAIPIGAAIEEVQKVFGEPILLQIMGKYAMSSPLRWGPTQRRLLRLCYVLIVGLRSRRFTDGEILEWFIENDVHFLGGVSPIGWIETYESSGSVDVIAAAEIFISETQQNWADAASMHRVIDTLTERISVQ